MEKCEWCGVLVGQESHLVACPLSDADDRELTPAEQLVRGSLRASSGLSPADRAKNDGRNLSPEQLMEAERPPFYGWQCPVCSTVWRPDVTSCGCSKPERG